MADQYQLTADCAYLTTETATGRAKVLAYRGAYIAPDAPELKHLLDSGMAAKVGDGGGFGLNAEGGLGAAETPAEGPRSVVSATVPTTDTVSTSADADAERRQAAARAKLPSDGSAPDGRASEDVWVEYAVARGMDRDEASKAGKEEIRKALSAQK